MCLFCLTSHTGPDPKPVLKGDDRTYRVWLDCNQYEIDLKKTNEGAEVRFYNETFFIFYFCLFVGVGVVDDVVVDDSLKKKTNCVAVFV